MSCDSSAPPSVAFCEYIDEEVLSGLENEASRLANDLNRYIHSLQMQVHQCAEITHQSTQACTLAAENVATAVHNAVSQSAQLMTLCDRLDHEMGQLATLKQQIREVKQTLEVMEYAMR
ncbi:hypothetical protein H4R34_003852 [Dimargaris verticillata]|uniref:BLOC-1-related complex subunit 6 C-terminal helix domain-containing protein n=1 Tax=Dimargaris verticillata TaxID=2761393 RepID=A0A9W8B1J1_9FUNG|nr:hypothetical protein H4R34_003852 [Dimargaris verticillata]